MKKIAFEFDPFELVGVEAPKDPKKRAEALSEIADFVKTEVLQYVGEASSPVAGGPWKRGLSPEYAKLKDGIGPAIANMEFTGDMLDSLEVVNKRGTKLSLQIEGEEAAKADGHNNHSGRSTLPERRFIPKKNETFKKPILDGIKGIAKHFMEDDE